MDLLLIPSYCSLEVSAIFSYLLIPSLLIAPLCFSSPLMGSLLFLIRYKAAPPPIYKGSLLSTKGLKPNLIPNPS